MKLEAVNYIEIWSDYPSLRQELEAVRAITDSLENSDKIEIAKPAVANHSDGDDPVLAIYIQTTDQQHCWVYVDDVTPNDEVDSGQHDGEERGGGSAEDRRKK